MSYCIFKQKKSAYRVKETWRSTFQVSLCIKTLQIFVWRFIETCLEKLTYHSICLWKLEKVIKQQFLTFCWVHPIVKNGYVDTHSAVTWAWSLSVEQGRFLFTYLAWPPAASCDRQWNETDFHALQSRENRGNLLDLVSQDEQNLIFIHAPQWRIQGVQFGATSTPNVCGSSLYGTHLI